MKPPSESERRKSPRVPVLETMDAAGGSESFPIEMLDLSASGARFRSDRAIPVDTAVRVNINFYPVDFPIKALVVWTRPVEGTDRYEHGAEFVNMPPEEAFLIKDYVLRAAGASKAT